MSVPFSWRADSSATTKPAEQAKITPSLGGVMHEWRQWLAPGVVVAVVLAMGSLQRADIRELRGKIDQVNDPTDRVNDRIDRPPDQVNNRFDQIYQLLLP